jgi:hypothetical protein
MSTTISAEQFKLICDGVWHDRTAILFWRGIMSGEDALVRAAYWRLCKAGGQPELNAGGYIPFLKNLVQQYRDEAGQGGPQA